MVFRGFPNRGVRAAKFFPSSVFMSTSTATATAPAFVSMTSPLFSMPLLPSRPGSGCARCEQLPAPLQGPGTLHLGFPLAHSLGKMRAFLHSSGLIWSQKEGVISIELPDRDLSPLAEKMASVLTSIETRDVTALFLGRGQNLTIQSGLDALPLWNWLGRARVGWLVEMVENERLTSHFHPIVHAQSGEVFAHEALLRGLDGEKTVPPKGLFEVATQAGMLFQLDLAARRSAIHQAAIHGLNSKIFINFTPSAIYDATFCLKTTVNLIKEVGFTPADIVFEVIESENVEDPGHLSKILDFYREGGFGVALDDLGSGFSGLNLLASLRPDYVKLDRALISGVDSDPYKAIITQKVLETAHDLGVQTVAEGIETEAEWRWLRENGVDFMQGFLFARPNLPPSPIHWPR